MMSKAESEKELSNAQKVLVMAVWSVVVFAALLIGGYFLGKSGDDTPQYIGCDTMYNPSPCPVPDEEFPTSEEAQSLPDVGPDDHPDNCGGSSCKQLEKEAEEEQQLIDREIGE